VSNTVQFADIGQGQIAGSEPNPEAVSTAVPPRPVHRTQAVAGSSPASSIPPQVDNPRGRILDRATPEGVGFAAPVSAVDEAGCTAPVPPTLLRR